MESDKREIIYCEDDGEIRIYCELFDKFCLERYYNNHLKSKLRQINSIKDNDWITQTQTSKIICFL